jgi:hypothetical protein
MVVATDPDTVLVVNTRVLLTASAVVLGVLGVGGSFLPQELLVALGVAPAGVLPVLVQVLAAALFGFAMVNWMARGNLIGGIYNRPVAIGNLAHFSMGAIALVKVVTAGQRQPIVLAITAVYLVFAICFWVLYGRSPVKPVETP